MLVEKAVDIHLAVDMLTMALDDAYDHAYLLSADGDYTPVVAAVRKQNKKVYAASLQMSHALKGAADQFFHLQPAWFSDCYRDPPPKSEKWARKGKSAAARAGETHVPVVVKKTGRKPTLLLGAASKIPE